MPGISEVNYFNRMHFFVSQAKTAARSPNDAVPDRVGSIAARVAV